MFTRTAKIASRVGLHARPAAVFAKAAEDEGIEITISFDGDDADAASILEVMSLGAMHGDEVTLSTEDEGGEAALERLATLLETDLEG
ncbi:HPr family phosphocarrier protein [Trueperella pecoris]|uniref:Phosphocarrier protein HPr n=1 Tax=Trueperella pecoris TaxID=2733571 RepID=A0A7M1QU60_9ACTO|nr:HPr family phosphocarrier protein [Trueperella pecoris]QOQ38141.1 HPr family phosphocarrier protein [Trueperella pecoris]QOR45373.1 HPr family phosphocarrier protein [Trueperella pecoris]